MGNDQDRHENSIEELAKTQPDIWKEIYLRGKLLALVARIKSSAKRKKIPFNLNADHLSLPERCPILGIKLHFHTVASEDDSYSIDRIDNTKGYTMDNICIMSLKANRMKLHGTLEDLVKMGNWAQSRLTLDQK